MGGNGGARHTDQLATKSKFFDCVACAGNGMGGLGGFYGCDVDGNGEYAYIQVHTPHDFEKLVALMLAVIPTATVANMTMRVVTNYCRPGEPYTQHNKLIDDKSFTAVQNILTEIDITDLVDLPNGRLDKKDYLGIQVSRQAGDTMDAIVIGAKLRYR
jgi:hypothetical protein